MHTFIHFTDADMTYKLRVGGGQRLGDGGKRFCSDIWVLCSAVCRILLFYSSIVVVFEN